MTDLKNNTSKGRVKRHIIAWSIIIIIILLTIFLSEPKNDPSFQHYMYQNILFTLEAAILIYISFYLYNVLIPKNKCLLFILGTIAAIFFISFVDYFINASRFTMNDDKKLTPIVLGFIFMIVAALTVKLIYRNITQLRNIKSLKNDQIHTESKLLNAQVNPHFLFNTLNNIYAENLKDPDNANKVLLNLSDLLRYQLESHKTEFIAFSDEISILQNYVELEKIRVHNLEVDFQIYGETNDILIPSLIFLPIVENAFKYGIGVEKNIINIAFKINTEKIRFSCYNLIADKITNSSSNGIGLKNVQDRLTIYYPDHHDFNIEKTTSSFLVTIEINFR